MNLTESEIQNLRGLELRAAVATEIFELKGVRFSRGHDLVFSKEGFPHDVWVVPHYEEDANALELLTDEMERRGCKWVVQYLNNERYYARFSDAAEGYGAHSSENKKYAVCRAALLFVKAQGEK